MVNNSEQMASLNKETSSSGFGDVNDNRKRKADDTTMETDKERPYLAPISASQIGAKKSAKDIRRGNTLA